MAQQRPMPRDAGLHLNPSADRLQQRGLEVLDQMFAYFDFADLPFVRPDESADYSRAA